jgi:hypothetical protein
LFTGVTAGNSTFLFRGSLQRVWDGDMNEGLCRKSLRALLTAIC